MEAIKMLFVIKFLNPSHRNKLACGEGDNKKAFQKGEQKGELLMKV
jgi:hypothetical protein